jgi:hypothetical protein
MLDVLPAQPLDAEQVPVPKRMFPHEIGTIGARLRCGKDAAVAARRAAWAASIERLDLPHRICTVRRRLVGKK